MDDEDARSSLELAYRGAEIRDAHRARAVSGEDRRRRASGAPPSTTSLVRTRCCTAWCARPCPRRLLPPQPGRPSAGSQSLPDSARRPAPGVGGPPPPEHCRGSDVRPGPDGRPRARTRHPGGRAGHRAPAVRTAALMSLGQDHRRGGRRRGRSAARRTDPAGPGTPQGGCAARAGHGIGRVPGRAGDGPPGRRSRKCGSKAGRSLSPCLGAGRLGTSFLAQARCGRAPGGAARRG